MTAANTRAARREHTHQRGTCLFHRATSRYPGIPPRRQKVAHLGTFGGSRQLGRCAERYRPVRLSVEENHAVSDAEKAPELVRYQHDGDSQAVPQRQHELVKASRAERIQPGGRFVQEEDRRIERERARDPRACASTAKARRVAVFFAGEPDEGELEACQLGTRIAVE